MGIPPIPPSAPYVPMPAPYLGQVATHCRVHDTLYAPNIKGMARSRHVARDNIASLQAGFANWYLDGSNTRTEAVTAQTQAVTASIEYPVGTFTQLRFSGAVTGTIAAASTLISDAAAVVIPRGAVFYVRNFINSPAGIMFTQKTPAANVANGEAYAVSDVTDQTMGGTITDSGANANAYPVLLIANTLLPSIALMGDSRIAGQNDSFVDGPSDVGELERAVGPLFGFTNLSMSGERISEVSSNYSKRLALLRYCTHALVTYGINDCLNGRSAAQVLADQQTFYSLILPLKIIQSTLSPLSTSSDNFATTNNQTPVGANSARIAVNRAIRDVPAQLTNFLEHADQVETVRDSSIWRAPGYTSDGVHALPLGYRTIASGISPAIAALIRR